MRTVGLREFKNQCSKYVSRAKQGESISITDRGQIVAELTPARQFSESGAPVSSLDELRRKGIVYGSGKNVAALYPAMERVLKRRSSILLDEERGSQ